MKFCKRKYFEYAKQGVVNSVHYITEQDMIDMHGVEFVTQWKAMACNLTVEKFGNESGYYYMDYEHYARATDSFLIPVA